MIFTIFLPLILGSLSTVAIILSIAALRNAPRSQIRRLAFQLNELKADILACLDRIDAVEGIARRKYARDAARAGRAAKKNGSGAPDPATDPEGWKKYMQAQLVLNNRS